MPISLDAALINRLAPWGFDLAQLNRFETRTTMVQSNAVAGTVTPPAEGDVSALPEPGTPAHDALAELGRAALAQGKVGVVVLAGGMATRFGGVVKAAVPVLGERTFLQLKLDDIRRTAGDTVPVFIMSSFATDARLREHVTELGAQKVSVFPQFVSLRLTPQGELFLEDGQVSAYATGHGDLTFALRRSGLLERFRAAGGTVLVMSNVDNLGATLNPAVVGAHLQSGAALTAEVVRKEPGDKGGAPARLDGVPQIIEGFRFPKDFDQDRIPVFNTNTFTLDAAAIDRDFELPYYRVEKSVDGRPAIQFERLVGELTAFLPSRFLEVPRTGRQSRFLPVKDPDELRLRLPTIREALQF